MKKLFLNETFILSLILINAAVIFFIGYVESDSIRNILDYADHGITALFIVELLVKFRAIGFRPFLRSGWNKFDLVLVLMSLPSLVLFVFNLPVGDLGVVLIFRVFRVFKVSRFLSFVPNVERLLISIGRALRTSVFVILLFFVYIFIVGILSFQLFHETGSGYFDNPVIALYSTFKIFTIEGWFEIPETIVIGMTELRTFMTYMYFIAVVITGGIFGLSIVNSIFVDTMMSDNNNQLEEQVKLLDEKVSELIKKIDNQM